VIICTQVLEHVPNPFKAVSERCTGSLSPVVTDCNSRQPRIHTSMLLPRTIGAYEAPSELPFNDGFKECRSPATVIG